MPRSLKKAARWPAAAVVALTAALIATRIWPPRPRLLWNASASSPVGFYRVRSVARLRAGDTVVAWAPREARLLASARRYLPADVPLVKRVAAVPGDRVCASGKLVRVNGRPVAVRRSGDRRGRLLPSWSGCRLLQHGELMLISAAGPDSFDGRYFGISKTSDIIGKATLLWAPLAKRAASG